MTLGRYHEAAKILSDWCLSQPELTGFAVRLNHRIDYSLLVLDIEIPGKKASHSIAINRYTTPSEVGSRAYDASSRMFKLLRAMLREAAQEATRRADPANLPG